MHNTLWNTPKTNISEKFTLINASDNTILRYLNNQNEEKNNLTMFRRSKLIKNLGTRVCIVNTASYHGQNFQIHVQLLR